VVPLGDARPVAVHESRQQDLVQAGDQLVMKHRPKRLLLEVGIHSWERARHARFSLVPQQMRGVPRALPITLSASLFSRLAEQFVAATGFARRPGTHPFPSRPGVSLQGILASLKPDSVIPCLPVGLQVFAAFGTRILRIANQPTRWGSPPPRWFHKLWLLILGSGGKL